MLKWTVIFGMLFIMGCGGVSELESRPASSPPASKQELKQYPDVKVSRLLRIIDGDTFACDIDEHSAIAGKNISIRLRGINTPELRAKNPEERQAAQREKQRLADLLSGARTIELRNLGRDKYFRINADVYIDGENILPYLNPEYIK